MNKIALALILTTGVTTTAAFSADLVSAYRDAVAYDFQFAAAKASHKAGQEKLAQGRAGLLPTISLAANTAWNDRNFFERRTSVAESNLKYNTNGWTAVLTQPLYRWQNWESYNQSQLQVAIADAQFEAARQDLIVRVAQAYFDVLQAREVIKTLEAQKTAIAGQLKVAKRSYEVGTVTIVDIHEAQSRFDLASATTISAQNDLQAKQHALQKLIGKVELSLKSLRPGIALPPPQPDNIDKWIESAESANLSVRVAQAAYEIASREVSRQRAENYPTLDLVATKAVSTIGGSASINPGSETNTATIGLQLAVPIFTGGAAFSRGRETAALLEKSHADLENARLSAKLQTRQAYLDVIAGLSQVSAFEAALASSQSALDSNKSGYEVGVRLNIDVLNAQSQLYDTRQKLMKARNDTVVALIRLKAAAGTLSDEDIIAVNALLE